TPGRRPPPLGGVRAPAAVHRCDLRARRPPRADREIADRRRARDRGGDPAFARPARRRRHRCSNREACRYRGRMIAVRERLARTPPGYRFSIGRILAIYSGLMVTL